MFLLSPIFGRRNVPARFKAGFALILTLIIVPLLPDDISSPAIRSALDGPVTMVYAVAVLKEMVVGLLLGFTTTVFLSIAVVTGQLTDVAMGLGIGSVFDPQMNTQMPLTGSLLNTAMFLYFIIANGHLHLIQILGRTFVSAPLGQIRLTTGLAWMMTEQFILSFALAVTLMLPVIAMTLIIEIGMGVLTRAIPQLHAYLVGIPVKVITGFTVLLLLQPVYVNFCDSVFEKMFLATGKMVESLGGTA